MENMTALVSTFARAYHFLNNRTHIFADPLAIKMLADGEYAAISSNMAKGISFFAPGFRGTDDEALRFIVDRQLSPSVLARSAFCERALGEAVYADLRQVVVFACGYDTFSLRTKRSELTVFDLDLPEMIEDRKQRIERSGLLFTCHEVEVACDLSNPDWKDALKMAGFDESKPFFGSLLGISYYLEKDAFKNLLGAISSLASNGSSICFDYPMEDDGEHSLRNRALAAAAGEKMKARYGFGKLQEMLHDAGFTIVEHMNAEEITQAFFKAYNQENAGHVMAAPEGVGYCIAKKRS